MDNRLEVIFGFLARLFFHLGRYFELLSVRPVGDKKLIQELIEDAYDEALKQRLASRGAVSLRELPIAEWLEHKLAAFDACLKFLIKLRNERHETWGEKLHIELGNIVPPELDQDIAA